MEHNTRTRSTWPDHLPLSWVVRGGASWNVVRAVSCTLLHNTTTGPALQSPKRHGRGGRAAAELGRLYTLRGRSATASPRRPATPIKCPKRAIVCCAMRAPQSRHEAATRQSRTRFQVATHTPPLFHSAIPSSHDARYSSARMLDAQTSSHPVR